MSSKTTAKCPFEKCSSSIISYQEDKLITLPRVFLEKYKLLSASEDITQTPEVKFLVTKDIWDFDNIGVSRSIESLNLENNTPQETETLISFGNEEYKVLKAIKYLICADCDKGPLGLILEVQRSSEETAPSNQINLLNIDLCK